MSAKTLFDKLWNSHLVRPESRNHPAVLYIDLHLIHEVTSPQAFGVLRERGLPVRRPDRTFATADHAAPSLTPDGDGRVPFVDEQAKAQVEKLSENCGEHGITLFPIGHRNQGIVHVIGPELGLTQPGKTIVCGDSHTATHGAFGALAFGIGTSEVGHVLATQCLLQRKPKSMVVDIHGRLGPGVSAKDLILALIAKIGVGGGTGHVIEYRGEAIRALSMEERMTVCNMSIEAGARAGMIAADDTTFQYLAGRERSPQGAQWDRSLARWRNFATDEGACFDTRVTLDAGQIEPMITYGTHPGMGISINDPVPANGNSDSHGKALAYMGLTPGQPLMGKPVDVVFIGSCTNSRLSDLRAAAAIMKGRRVAKGVRALVVPGSRLVKEQAEREGLAAVFKAAGAQWREPSCSMCIAMNGDQMQGDGELVVSTSNRNFEGRQGKGGANHLGQSRHRSRHCRPGRHQRCQTIGRKRP